MLLLDADFVSVSDRDKLSCMTDTGGKFAIDMIVFKRIALTRCDVGETVTQSPLFSDPFT